MRESEDSHPRAGVGLVSQAVARLLGWGPVIAESIRLHDQIKLRPVEVNTEPIHSLTGPRRRQARPPNQPQESTFQF